MIGVKQLLQDFRGGAKRCTQILCVNEEVRGRLAHGMWFADRIHEHVAVNKDQGLGNPLIFDSLITARCSSQSGSRPGPASACTLIKKSSHIIGIFEPLHLPTFI